MDHVKIKGATRHNVGAAQGYIGISIRDEIVDGTPIMSIALRPTPEETAKIVAGEPFTLSIMGKFWPPVMVTVGGELDED